MKHIYFTFIIGTRNEGEICSAPSARVYIAESEEQAREMAFVEFKENFDLGDDWKPKDFVVGLLYPETVEALMSEEVPLMLEEEEEEEGTGASEEEGTGASEEEDA